MNAGPTGPSGHRQGPLSLVPTVRCPHCGFMIDGPFYRARIPHTKTHSNGGKSHSSRCRVIVVPDPIGERHEVFKVRDGESKEAAMLRVVRDLGLAA